MVKVRFEKKEYEALKKFEKLHHPDIWKWIVEKVNDSKHGDNPLRVLDISDEASIFSFMLAEEFPETQITCAIQDDMPNIEIPKNVRVEHIKSLTDTIPGDYDVVLLKEVTKDIGDLEAILKNVIKVFGDHGGKVILLARPKNPPLPVPTCVNLLWPKLALSREEILKAANGANLEHSSFSASIPCSVPKFDWEAILFSGCYPAVKKSQKCTEKEIMDFCKNRPPKMSFEEKISMYVLSTPSGT